MLLIYAIAIIEFEAITEGLIKRHSEAISAILFKGWVQWLITGLLFSVWLAYALHFDKYYVPLWKLIAGFVGLRFLIFDTSYNLAAGQRWDHYGTSKLYDRIMTELGGFGIFLKAIAGGMGIAFLLGYN